MIDIQENISLLPYNTLRVDARARYFIEINTPDDFATLLDTKIYQDKRQKKSITFIGGGSNMLITQDIDGLVIKNNITTMRLTKFTDEEVVLTVWWGYNRHKLVLHCAERWRRGLENLALIPGTVGAAPIQNIGAYWVEAKDLIQTVKGFNLSTNNMRALNNRECHFGYRDSVFKQELKDNFFITHVTFKLSKKPQPVLSYGALQSLQNKKNLSPQDIVQEVIQIRSSKLPSIKDIGTAGSFFKNPIIENDIYTKLLTDFPTLIARPVEAQDDEQQWHKLSAAQLLELAGVTKGMRDGDIGTYEKHALVIVNHGEANGRKIEEFITELQIQVEKKTWIRLEPEVNII